MSRERRRELIREFKEQTVTAGVVAVRCTATNEAWVVASRNIERQQTSLWFSLRLGGHPDRSLQQAWDQHGEDAFTLEVLEQIDGELPDYLKDMQLRERTAHWRDALSRR